MANAGARPVWAMLKLDNPSGHGSNSDAESWTSPRISLPSKRDALPRCYAR